MFILKESIGDYGSVLLRYFQRKSTKNVIIQILLIQIFLGEEESVFFKK